MSVLARPASAEAKLQLRAGRRIAENFAEAAPTYDAAASVQAEIAKHLIAWAAETAPMPQTLLDLGCGTGFAAEAAAAQWPNAQITALDTAPAMLQAVRRKLPRAEVTLGDASLDLPPARFDLIVSSMMLHWLPDPAAVLLRWRKALQPGGRLYVALLVAGSFAEWRDLCRAQGARDGLWPLPEEKLLTYFPMIRRHRLFPLTVDYLSARDFLQRLKATGAATPREGHRPLGAVALRRILRRAKTPFPVTYRTLFLELAGENT